MTYIPREIANTTINPILIPRFMNIINSTFGGFQQVNVTRPNWTNATTNTLMTYPDAMGIMAYLIIILIPFAMMWISNGNMKMASVVGLLVGGFAWAFLPATYVSASYICIVISVAAGIWGLMRPS